MQRNPFVEFVCGGGAAMCAVTFTNPLDMARTRLQLQGELGLRGDGKTYRNVWHCLYSVAKQEGLRGLQKGLVSGGLYQVAMNGCRLTLHEPFQQIMPFPEDYVGLTACIAGAASGAVGAFFASPFYLVKTRLQSKSSAGASSVGHQHNIKGTWDGLKQLARGGPFAILQGASGAVPRVAVGSAAQLGTYSKAKSMLSSWLGIADGIGLHFASSMLSGMAVVATMTPFDVASTRLYNAPAGVYKGPLDCMLQTVRAEGPLALYKGSLALWIRVGPHSVIMLVLWEKFRKIADQVRSA